MASSLLLLAAFAGGNYASGIYDPAAPTFTLPPLTAVPTQDAPAEKEKPQWLGFGWSGGLSAGMTILAGNTRSQTGFATFSAQGRGEDDRVTVGANYLTGRTEERDPTSPNFRRTTVTARQVSANAKYDRFLNEAETTYAYINGLLLKDGIRDLDLLYNVGVGAGVQWLEDDVKNVPGLGARRMSLFTEAGIGYTDEDYAEPPPPADSNDTEYLSARAALHYDLDVTATAFFFHDSYWIPSLEDFQDDQIIHTETGLRTKISDSVNMEAKVIFDWDSSPAAGRGRRDVAYVVGANWSF